MHVHIHSGSDIFSSYSERTNLLLHCVHCGYKQSACVCLFKYLHVRVRVQVLACVSSSAHMSMHSTYL